MQNKTRQYREAADMAFRRREIALLEDVELVPKYSESQLEASSRIIQKRLAELGWYLSFGELTLDVIVNWGQYVKSAPDREIDAKLVEYARTRVEKVRRECQALWPHRAFVLEDAFAAHQNATYTTSIPTMLAQADGMCHELLRSHMFGKERGNPKVPRTAAALDKSLSKIVVNGQRINIGLTEKMRLDSLRLVTKLSENTNLREFKDAQRRDVRTLNRHGVLHGLDVDYPSETNSMRCILLLDFLDDVRRTLASMIKRASDWELWLRDPGAWLKARAEAQQL